MKRIAVIVSFTSCDSEDAEFTIVGRWGVVSGQEVTDGGTIKYNPLPDGQYYEVVTYGCDGRFNVLNVHNVCRLGSYSFDSITNELSYKLDSDKEFSSAHITILDCDRIEMSIDEGRVIKYHIRLD